MGHDVFHFQQFSIRQDKSAMKVGTDGVLVGTWTVNSIGEYFNLSAPSRILDIGTGNGLIALIMAQLMKKARITAVEVNRDAAGQARENTVNSKFGDRIEVIQEPIQQFAAHTDQRFDAIVTNPPYFVRAYLPSQQARRKARHSVELPFSNLITCVDQLLTPNGLFTLILPFNVSQSFSIQAAARGLHLIRLTGVRDSAEHPTIRHLLMFSRNQWPFRRNRLTLYKKGREERSAAFHNLTKEFYLQP